MKYLFVVIMLLFSTTALADNKAARLERLRKEALAVSPRKSWVQSSTNPTLWMYGYYNYSQRIFYYNRTMYTGLSDFRSLYPINMQMYYAAKPRWTAVYERD
jgi:hypothetical protein